MARWRFLKASFTWWFGLIWALVGVVFLVSGLATLAVQGNAEPAPAGAVSEPWWRLPLIFTSVGFVLGGVGLVLVTKTLAACSRHLGLLRDGFAAVGTVTAVEENLRVRINQRHPRFLRYQFTDAVGQLHSERSSYLPREFEHRFAPGAAIVVLYDPNDPTKNTVDIFGDRAHASTAFETNGCGDDRVDCRP
ncbi:MAG: DUF3592 domain-containing protein [Planctomycetota bacterium]